MPEVHYREGQMVKKGDPLVDIDARPYEAQLAQAQGRWNAIKICWPSADGSGALSAGMGEECDPAAKRWTDPRKSGAAGQGTVKNDEGTVQYDQCRWVTAIFHFADQRPRGPAPDGPGQSGDGELDDDPGGGGAKCSHHRHFHAR